MINVINGQHRVALDEPEVRWELEDQFIESVDARHLPGIKSCLDKGVDPNCSSGIALILAAKNNDCAALEILFPFSSDEKTVRSRCVIAAAKGGALEALKWLLERVQIIEDDNYAMVNATEMGQLEALKILLPYQNPNGVGCAPLVMAVVKGQEECFDFLYPHSAVSESLALHFAVRYNRIEMLKRILVDASASEREDALIESAKEGRLQAFSTIMPYAEDFLRDSLMSELKEIVQGQPGFESLLKVQEERWVLSQEVPEVVSSSFEQGDALGSLDSNGTPRVARVVPGRRI